MRITTSLYQSPLGILALKTDDIAITSILFTGFPKGPQLNNEEPEIKESDHPILKECARQLQEYFDGKRKRFDLPMEQTGSVFQQKVWAALLDIQYGKTISYMELSKRVGDVKATRAVGSSNGKNKISIIVPCHRVIGSNGSLTGYAGGLWRKQWLLEHEGKHENGIQTLF